MGATRGGNAVLMVSPGRGAGIDFSRSATFLVSAGAVNFGIRVKTRARALSSSGVVFASFARSGFSGSALLKRKPSPDFDSCQTTFSGGFFVAESGFEGGLGGLEAGHARAKSPTSTRSFWVRTLDEYQKRDELETVVQELDDVVQHPNEARTARREIARVPHLPDHLTRLHPRPKNVASHRRRFDQARSPRDGARLGR